MAGHGKVRVRAVEFVDPPSRALHNLAGQSGAASAIVLDEELIGERYVGYGGFEQEALRALGRPAIPRFGGKEFPDGRPSTLQAVDAMKGVEER